MKTFTNEERLEALALAREMPLIHERLMRVGLIRTAQSFHTGALYEVGYEIAEIADQTDRKARQAAASLS